MAVFNSNSITLAIGTTATIAGATAAFAHAQGFTLSFSNSLADVTTTDSDSWEEMISGRKSATISVNGLVDFETVSGAGNNFPTFSGLAVAGTPVFFELVNGTDADNGDGWTGSGYIESFEFSGESDQAATYSASIKVSGALTPVSS